MTRILITIIFILLTTNVASAADYSSVVMKVTLPTSEEKVFRIPITVGKDEGKLIDLDSEIHCAVIPDTKTTGFYAYQVGCYPRKDSKNHVSSDVVMACKSLPLMLKVFSAKKKNGKSEMYFVTASCE